MALMQVYVRRANFTIKPRFETVKELTRQQSGKEYLPTHQKYKCERHQRRRARRNGYFRRLKRSLVVKFFRLT